MQGRYACVGLSLMLQSPTNCIVGILLQYCQKQKSLLYFPKGFRNVKYLVTSCKFYICNTDNRYCMIGCICMYLCSAKVYSTSAEIISSTGKVLTDIVRRALYSIILIRRIRLPMFFLPNVVAV